LRALLVAAVALLLIAAIAAIAAVLQAQETSAQAAVAAASERDAETARDEAREAASRARSRELAAAAAAALDEDPTLSRMLAVSAGDEHAIDGMTVTALHAAWVADRVVDRITVPADVPISTLVADMHPDGTLAVMSSAGHGLVRQAIMAVDLAEDETLWTYRAPPGAEVGPARFSTDGRWVVAAVSGQPDSGGTTLPPASLDLGLMIWDARSGQLVDRIAIGPCGGRLLDVASTVALIVPTPEDDSDTEGCHGDSTDRPVEAVDLQSGKRRPIAEATAGDATLSGDGRWVAFSSETSASYVVADLASGRRRLEIPFESVVQDDKFVRAIDDDGSAILLGDRPILLADVEAGSVTAVLSGGGGESLGVSFTPDGSLALASGRDAVLRAWDVTTGRQQYAVPGAGAGWLSAAAGGRVLVSDWASNRASVVEPSVPGELGTVPTCAGFVPAGSLKVVGSVAALSTECGQPSSPTYVVDLDRPGVRFALAGSDGQDLALSDDGRLFARQESVDHVIGPIHVYSTETGERVAEMAGLCAFDELAPGPPSESGPCEPFPTQPFGLWNAKLLFSPDGTLLVAIDAREHYLAIWDAMTGEPIEPPTELPGIYDAVFSPAGDQLIVSTVDGEIIAIQVASWTIARRQVVDEGVRGREQIGLIDYLPEGDSIVAVAGMLATGGGWLVRVDAASLEVGPRTRIHDAAPKAATLSPDGTRVATGAADGRVRIWDSRTFKLLQELRVDGQAQGMAFLDDDRIAITPQTGDLLIMALDPAEVLDTVRAGITRGFTSEECERFGFVDACPTLEDLRDP
jgi:WD40 repeat protein